MARTAERQRTEPKTGFVPISAASAPTTGPTSRALCNGGSQNCTDHGTAFSLSGAAVISHVERAQPDERTRNTLSEPRQIE